MAKVQGNEGLARKEGDPGYFPSSLIGGYRAMNDLFPCTCPHCGQPMPDADPTPFSEFWASVPYKVNKSGAEKAWRKLSNVERMAAAAKINDFYKQWRKANPQASPIHVATYLNNKRWQDQGEVKQAIPQAHRLAQAANAIASGKRFLCTQISASIARECIAAGHVTEQQCREVGVL